ncbi:MAG: phage late control D family protein [bacterium]|nr:phage late control D family protein [bacterium]
MAEETTPDFAIYLNGTKLAQEQHVAVKSIVIIEIIDAPSIFMIRMADDSDRTLTDSTDWAEGTEVKIEIGYKDNISEIITGEITAIMPDFVKNSDSAVTFKGNSFLHRLDRGKKSQSFSEMTDGDIIKQLADTAEIEHDVADIGVEKPFTLQRDMTDMDYIMSLAQSYSCRVWAEGKKMFVQPAGSNSDGDVVLEWGKTLLDFSPRLTCRKLIDEVEVRGSKNPHEMLTGTATCADITFKIGDNTLGGEIAKDSFGTAKAIFIDPNIKDQNAADKAALEYITENSMRYMKASGKCSGNIKVKAGTMLELKALGEKFSGKYFVTSVKHNFIPLKGFETSFFVERNTGIAQTSSSNVQNEQAAQGQQQQQQQESDQGTVSDDEWFEIELLDDEGNAIGDQKYEVYDVHDNMVASGTLNGEGYDKVEEIDPTKRYYVKFPEIEEEDDSST